MSLPDREPRTCCVCGVLLHSHWRPKADPVRSYCSVHRRQRERDRRNTDAAYREKLRVQRLARSERDRARGIAADRNRERRAYRTSEASRRGAVGGGGHVRGVPGGGWSRCTGECGRVFPSNTLDAGGWCGGFWCHRTDTTTPPRWRRSGRLEQNTYIDNR